MTIHESGPPAPEGDNTYAGGDHAVIALPFAPSADDLADAPDLPDDTDVTDEEAET